MIFLALVAAVVVGNLVTVGLLGWIVLDDPTWWRWCERRLFRGRG